MTDAPNATPDPLARAHAAASRRLARLRDRALQAMVGRFLRRPRTSRVGGMTLVAPPGVFHPGLFFSTRVMVDWIASADLAGLRVLDLGSGSGALGIAAARAGADVAAVELNPLAQLATLDNAHRNGVRLRLYAGDGLAALPAGTRFDLVVCNPPWFEGEADSDAALAFRAGAGLRFVDRLFAGAGDMLADGGRLVTVLGASADRAQIDAVAKRHGWAPEPLLRRKMGWEWQEIDAWRRVEPAYQS